MVCLITNNIRNSHLLTIYFKHAMKVPWIRYGLSVLLTSSVTVRPIGVELPNFAKNLGGGSPRKIKSLLFLCCN